MRQPVFEIWGHALGRLSSAEPCRCRVEEVLDAIAESRAAIGQRYPLASTWRRNGLRRARARGIRFVTLDRRALDRARLRQPPLRRGTARRGWIRRAKRCSTRSPPTSFARRCGRPGEECELGKAVPIFWL